MPEILYLPTPEGGSIPDASMTALGERTLIAYLVDPDALGAIARDGIDEVMVPTAELRPLLRFSLDYYFSSGCAKAPSIAVLKSEYGDVLDDAEVDIEHDPEDSVEWAIADLKATWVYKQAGTFNKEFATEMAEVAKPDRVVVVNDYATRLVSMGIAMESRQYRSELRAEAPQLMARYHQRVAARGTFTGLGFGLHEVDDHTYGIHDGELVILAAAPKAGKSMFVCWTALKEFQRGRSVMLYTLENSVEMMLDRIACMAMAVDSSAWDRGEATDEEVERVQFWVDEIGRSEDGQNRLHIHKPDLGQRSFQHMIREAQLLTVDSILIDQLTHVEVSDGHGDRRPKHEKIGDALHLLKGMISTGHHPMPCLLTHQINRDGVKAADKNGYLEIYHLAEAAETERTADFIFGLYASRDEKAVRQAKLQMLGARRTSQKNWQIQWRPEIGNVRVRHEIELEH